VLFAAVSAAAAYLSCSKIPKYGRRRFDLFWNCQTQEGTAASCKQGNKQPVALFTIPVKEWRQEDTCKFNQSSNNCLLTIRYNTQKKYTKTYTGHW
jgi:hypothetical protein